MKKNIDLFVEDIVREMFRGTSKNILAEEIKADTPEVKASKRELGNTFQKYYDSLSNGEKDTLSDVAKNLGVNLDKGATRNAEVNKLLNNPNVNGSYEKAVGSISNELKQALADYNEWATLGTPKERKQEILRKYGGYGGLRRYIDIADKLSITPAYAPNRAGSAGINNAPFGTNYKTQKVLKDENGYPLSYIDDKGKEVYKYDDNITLSKTKPMPTPEVRDKKDNEKIIKPALPADKIVGYDYSNLDLTNVKNSDILSYFKSGTRKGHVFTREDGGKTGYKKGINYAQLADLAMDAMKAQEKNKKIELKNKTAKKKKPKVPVNRKGIRAMADLKNLYFKDMFNKILNSKYGYDFKMPTAMYTYGNSKLPNDTLVINFTTAHRCPAWNECLVGDACYARGSEHNYEGLHKKNSNLHLMWQTAHKDPDLLAAMFKVIKMHLINPGNMAGALLNNPETSQKWFRKLNAQEGQLEPLKGLFDRLGAPSDTNVLAEPSTYANNGKNTNSSDEDDEVYESKSIFKASLKQYLTEAGKIKDPNAPLKMPKGARENLAMMIYSHNFDEIFDEQDLNVIKNTPNAFRAKFIRLNEEGDFIGQWLLDAFDKFAGELKLIGIQTAAYTCRNLNFDGIKNIIINASTRAVGTRHGLDSKLGEDDTSAAIARRFFAVPSEIYNRLEDTYRPNGKKFEYTIPGDEYDENGKKIKKNKKDYDGSKPIVPLHETSDGLHVIYDLKPFVNGNDSTGPTTFNDIHDKNGPTIKRRLYYKCPCGRHGDVLDEKGKPIKMDCYLCRMCYEPKNEETGEIYVLVEVHGDNIDSFNSENANQKRGLSKDMQTYKEAKEALHNLICESDDAFIKKDNPEEKGIEIVAENIINSVKEHLNKVAIEFGQKNKFDNMPAESKQFFRMMNLINEADKKRYNDIID